MTLAALLVTAFVVRAAQVSGGAVLAAGGPSRAWPTSTSARRRARGRSAPSSRRGRRPAGRPSEAHRSTTSPIPIRWSPPGSSSLSSQATPREAPVEDRHAGPLATSASPSNFSLLGLLGGEQGGELLLVVGEEVDRRSARECRPPPACEPRGRSRRPSAAARSESEVTALAVIPDGPLRPELRDHADAGREAPADVPEGGGSIAGRHGAIFAPGLSVCPAPTRSPPLCASAAPLNTGPRARGSPVEPGCPVGAGAIADFAVAPAVPCPAAAVRRADD